MNTVRCQFIGPRQAETMPDIHLKHVSSGRGPHHSQRTGIVTKMAMDSIATPLIFPDKIIIKAKAKENFPGTWLHAEVELPNFIRVAETEAGDGFLFTQDETITTVYIESAERLDGDAIKGTVSIRSASGRMLAKCVAMWR